MCEIDHYMRRYAEIIETATPATIGRRMKALRLVIETHRKTCEECRYPVTRSNYNARSGRSNLVKPKKRGGKG